MENKKICFLDTEFNATSYADQNDGYQEITEIGAVVFQLTRFSVSAGLRKDTD